MAGSGSGLGLGAGFAKGFANVLMQTKERDARRGERERARQDQLFAATLPTILENASSWDDVEGALTRYPEYFPGAGGKSKKDGGKMDAVRGVLKKMFDLGHLGKGGQPSAAEVGMDAPERGGLLGTGSPSVVKPTGAMPPQPIQQPGGVSGGILTPRTDGQSATQPQPADPLGVGSAMQADPASQQGAAPASKRQTLFGVPMMTPEEKATKLNQQQLAKMTAEVSARRDIAMKMGLDPQQAANYALFGSKGADANDPAKLGTVEAYLTQKQQEKGAPLTAEEQLIATHAFNGKKDPQTTAKLGSFEDYVARVATDKGVETDKLTAADIEKAKAAYDLAGKATKDAQGNPTALAEMVAQNPAIMQGMTPTEKSKILNEIANQPQMRAQYEIKRMEPIRAQAQTVQDALSKLITVDPKTGAAALTEGGAALFGNWTPAWSRSFGLANDTVDANAALQQIIGQEILDMIGVMKGQSPTGSTGFGQMNAQELNVLSAAATKLKGRLSETEATTELRTIDKLSKKILIPSVLEGRLLQAVTGAGAAGGGAGAARPTGPISLDTPIFIGPDGKPALGPAR